MTDYIEANIEETILTEGEPVLACKQKEGAGIQLPAIHLGAPGLPENRGRGDSRQQQ